MCYKLKTPEDRSTRARIRPDYCNCLLYGVSDARLQNLQVVRSFDHIHIILALRELHCLAARPSTYQVDDCLYTVIAAMTVYIIIIATIIIAMTMFMVLSS